MEQFLDFDIITLFKETGCSLGEIRRLLREEDGTASLAFLKERRVAIEEEFRRMERRRELLEDMIACLEELEAAEQDVLSLVEEAECTYSYFAIPRPSGSLKDFIDGYIALIEHCRACGREPRLPFGTLMARTGSRAGDAAWEGWQDQGFFFNADPDTQDNLVHVRQAGLYASLVHSGDAESHRQALADFFAAIAARNLEGTGPLYVFDLMNYAIRDGRSIYTARYSICTQARMPREGIGPEDGQEARETGRDLAQAPEPGLAPAPGQQA